MCLTLVFEQVLPCSIIRVQTEKLYSQSLSNMQAVTGVFLKPNKRNFGLQKRGSVHIWWHVCGLTNTFRFLSYSFTSSLCWIHFERTFYVVIYKKMVSEYFGEDDPRPPTSPAKHAPCLSFSRCEASVCISAGLPLIKRSCSWGPALCLYPSEETEVITAARRAAGSTSITTALTVETQLNDSTAAKASLPDVCFSLALLVLFLAQMIRFPFLHLVVL